MSCCKKEKKATDHRELTIEPGCIACGSCSYRAPEVFEVTDRSRIKADADIEKNEELIEAAVKACPVQVIQYKKNDCQ